MTEQFHIPGRLDPGRSALAILVSWLDKDRLRAETTFYVLAVGAVILAVIGTFLGWAWLNVSGVPSQPEIERYWIAQTCVVGLVALLAWLGYQPATRISLNDSGLAIKASGSTERIPVTEMVNVTRIPRSLYHQHYRRFERTRSAVSGNSETVVLLQTTSSSWILDIRPAEQALFVEALRSLIPHAQSSHETLVA